MKKSVIILLLFGVLFNMQAQNVNKSCVINYSKSYFLDSKDYVVAPFKWKAKQLVLCGSLVAGGAAVYFADDYINDQVPFPNASQRRGIKYGLSYFGNGFYTMPLMASMFFYGLYAKKEKPFSTALMGVKSFVLSTIFTRVLKYSLNRSRPDREQGPQFWGGPFNSFSLSFPSGHTTGVFAVASVLAQSYKNYKWVPVTSYFLATAVGISRVWTKKHWTSDVVFGALIGWSMGTLVSKINCFDEKSSVKVEGNKVLWTF